MKTILTWLSGVSQKILGALPDIVLAVEKAMQDGTITAQERKDLAMFLVERLCLQWNIKLNFLAKWAISWAIDALAKKLPPKDNTLNVPQYLITLTKDF